MTPADYAAAIDKAFLEFRDHEIVTKDAIGRWIDQFPHDDRPTAVKVLSNVDYFPASSLRLLTSQLVGSIFAQYKAVSKRNVYFFPMGGAGSGAQLVARFVKESKGVVPANVVQLSDIEGIPAKEIKVAVLFDDFSGSGETIKTWWDTVEQLILPKAENIVLGLLIIHHQSLDRLRSEMSGIRIVYSKKLTPKKNVLSNHCKVFTTDEKKQLIAACNRTHCAIEYVHGFKECGLLVALKHGCPNNSLPILWHSSRQWRAIFLRRSI